MTVDLAYVAGFVDGEGSLAISKNGSVSLSIVNTSRKALQYVLDTLGVGVIQDRKQRVNKTQYVYRAYGEDCMAAVHKLLPFLIDKKPQAETLIEYRALPSHIRIPGLRGRRTNPERAGYAQRMKELKRDESV